MSGDKHGKSGGFLKSACCILQSLRKSGSGSYGTCLFKVGRTGSRSKTPCFAGKVYSYSIFSCVIRSDHSKAHAFLFTQHFFNSSVSWRTFHCALNLRGGGGRRKNC